jgi:hypothetical protein
VSTNSKGFFSTIPGVITGLAGVLTAVVGLGTLLIQLGVVGGSGGSSPKPGSTVTTAPGSSGASGGSGTTSALAGFRISPTSVELSANEKTAPVTVENTGNTVLSFQQPVLAGTGKDQFTVTSRCNQLQPDDNCTVTITFKGLLDASATLTISARGGASPKDVPVRGKLL